ncbi:MAG: T9SS type A sorting domain-containing protein, partial [Lentimicrobium sp.]|nr:T9SS type A sorting domain-containing protein [Lentimicrobium sp.]
GAAGVYEIIPAATANNYSFTPVNGHLYVNPFGSGANNLIVSLVCVEQIPPDENGFTYIAYFKYLNQNTTPVYVQAGLENRLTGAGQYSSSGIPQLFMPGEGIWEVRFDGVPVTWTVRSYKNWTKTASLAMAGSTSVQCNKSLMVTEQPESPVELELEMEMSVYPNPASDKIFVNLNNNLITADDVFLFDMTGKQYQVRSVKPSERMIEVDLSAIKAGMYILRIKTPEEIKVYRIIRH